ncbi:MAG: amidohydrolase [Opitutae bacterium]|nr:amidohydrolase [Opitutae bacterium]
MKIDSHHHFWKYDPIEYSWMNENMDILKKDYGPNELEKEINHSGIDGVVSVQASQTLKETDILLSHAEKFDFIKGVVGWLPLSNHDVKSQLEFYSSNNLFKGVRHVVQDEPDNRFILGENFNKGISLLHEFNLIYDILIYERQLSASIEFVDQHPNQIFVLDHIAKPRIKDGMMEPWKSQIYEIAKRENVWCKISGIVTEASWKDWDDSDILPYMEIALEAFGSNRLMFGSDWPVARLAVEYCAWVDVFREFISRLSKDEQRLIEGEVATQVYGLNT